MHRREGCSVGIERMGGTTRAGVGCWGKMRVKATGASLSVWVKRSVRSGCSAWGKMLFIDMSHTESEGQGFGKRCVTITSLINTHLTYLQLLADRCGLHISMEHPGTAKSAFLIMGQPVLGKQRHQWRAEPRGSRHHRLDPAGPHIPFPSSHGPQWPACPCQLSCGDRVLHSPPS